MSRDLASSLAQYWAEDASAFISENATLPRAALREALTADTLARFPGAQPEHVIRAWAIYSELQEGDRRERYVADSYNNPCRCGAPGVIVVVDAQHKPTGDRWCPECDLAETAKTPCARCGGPMDPVAVLTGYKLCDACDPDGDEDPVGDEGASQ